MARPVNEIDLALARRIRECRKRQSLSQEELAKRLGVSFQQVQKYEKGINGVAAARLYEMARVFCIPVGALFPAPTDSPKQQMGSEAISQISDFALSPDGWRLCRAFLVISKVDVRKKVIALVESIAQGSMRSSPLNEERIQEVDEAP